MSDQALMILDKQNLSATFTDAAQALKDDALSTAALVGRVASAADNQIAADAQLKLANLRRTITKCHKEAKEPFLRACQQIDGQKNEYLEEILAEEIRITKLSGDWHALQDAKRLAAEQAARMEQERIDRERRQEEQRILRENAQREHEARLAKEALESKASREQAEAQQRIREATNEKARKQAEAIMAKQREENEREAIAIQRQQERAAANTHAELEAASERAIAAQAAVVVAPQVPVTAVGQTVKKDIEITVFDIHALARVHPGMVNITPRESDIKSAILAGSKITGVSHKEIFKPQTRGGSLSRAIDI